jgi:hypothetical protein
MNDIILNWKKLRKLIKSDKTENSINGKDRGYTVYYLHFSQPILEESMQRTEEFLLFLQ